MSRFGRSLLAVGVLLAAACVDDPVNIDPPAVGGSEPAGVAAAGSRDAERVTGSPGGPVATVFQVSENEMLAARRDLRSAGTEVLRTFRGLPIVVAGVDPEQAPRLDSLPFVDYMEPNIEYELSISEAPTGAVSASAFPGQTTPENIRKVRAESAWDVDDGEGAWLVFLDGGLVGGASGHHSDLASVDECWSTHSDADATDCTDDLASSDLFYSHGTMVAGVAIAEDNDSHIVGVAPEVDDWGMVRVCAPVCEWDAVIDALDSLATNGRKDIINMSFSGPTGSVAVSTAVSGAWNSGDLLVGAAGNAGVGTIEYPARYSSVVAVSGTTASDGLHEDSNYGADVDVSPHPT